MPETILRGRVLRFLREPAGIADSRILCLRRGRRDPRPRRPGRRRSAPAPEVLGAVAGGGGRRPSPAPDHAGLHRRPHPHAAGAGHRLVGSAAPRLAEHLHLPGRSQVLRSLPRRRASPAPFSTSSFATAPPPRSPTVRSHPASVDAYFAAAEARGAAHDRRQGDDGSQLPRGRPRHRAVAPTTTPRR